MLLSFFIILNSMSNFDVTKSQPVLNSLSVAFSKIATNEDTNPNFEEDRNQSSFGEGDSLDQLEGLFRSQITGVGIEKNRLGTVMKVSVSLEKFEKGIMTPVKPQNKNAVLGGIGGSFAPMLVSLLQSNDNKISYRLDMILNTDESPAKIQNDKPQEMERKIKKVSSFAEKLEKSGLPKKLITSGIGKGKEGMIDLIFRRYEPFNPLGDKTSGQNG